MIGDDRLVFSLILLCFLSLICCPSKAQSNDNYNPWEFTQLAAKDGGLKRELSWPTALLRGGVVIFSKYISPIDGDRCNMYPTCSAYSREAIEKHGFIRGYLLTVDRLIHESNETDRAPLISKWDRVRYLDPVSNNDFWWY